MIIEKITKIVDNFRGDILCEMRFYVPNMVEESGKSENEEMKKAEEKGEGEDADEPEEDGETPAQQFND